MPLVCQCCKKARPVPVAHNATFARTSGFAPPSYTCTEPGCGGQMEIKEDPPVVPDNGRLPAENWKAGFNGA